MKVIYCDFCGKEPAIGVSISFDWDTYDFDFCLHCLASTYKNATTFIKHSNDINRHLDFRRALKCHAVEIKPSETFTKDIEFAAACSQRTD